MTANPAEWPGILMSGPLPPPPGGMASVLAMLAESSLARRVRLELFDTAKRTPEGRSAWQGWVARASLMRRWWRQLGELPAAIAHIHTCSGLTFFLDGLLATLARARGVRVILHVHGARFDAFLDTLDPLRRRWAQQIARRADRVVVLSEEWRQRLQTRLPGARLTIIENGVPLPLPVSRQYESGPVRGIFLGSIGRRKGVPQLIEALVQAADGISLRLAGDEEYPGDRSAMQALAQQHGVATRLEFVGAVSGTAKEAFLREADFFVLPSLAEGLPISLLEAMASGLPVIATTVGAVPAVIEPMRNGLLVAPGAVVELRQAMERLAADPVLRSRLGAAGRETCIARYGVDRMADACAALYAELCPAFDWTVSGFPPSRE